MIPSSFKPDSGVPSSFKPDTSVQQPKSSFSDSIWASLAGNVGQAVQQGGDAVNSAFTAPGQSSIEQRINAAGAAAGAVPNVAASLIPGGKGLFGGLGNVASKAVNFAGNINDTLNAGAVKLGVMSPAMRAADQTGATNFANSSLGQGVERAANIGQSVGNISNLILGAQGAANLGDSAVGAVQNATGAAKGASYYADSLKPEPTQASVDLKDPALSKIQDLIAPKSNAAAVRQALAEGRVAPGQDPTLLRDGTPDQILPSSKMVQASKTIKEQIPGSENMSQPELHGALDGKITSIATKLKPEMQAVPITDEVLGKIQNSWDELKAQQVSDPYASTGANIDKLQAQFQSKFLDPIVSKRFSASMNDSLGTGQPGPTMDDLWDTAKAYDQSVPSNVKNANVLSTDALQTQKSIWLQNRAILRNAINDTATGLGETSQKAFSNMSDMFNAQKGIQSGYKLNKTGAESGVKTFLKSPAGKAVKIGAGIAGAGAIFKGGEALIP